MTTIFYDHSASRTGCTVQRVFVGEVELTNWQGQPVKSLPRSVVCEHGRILGSRQTYAHACIEGPTNNLTAAECRALAESLLLAADVLEGKQEAAEITRQREDYMRQCQSLAESTR